MHFMENLRRGGGRRFDHRVNRGSRGLVEGTFDREFGKLARISGYLVEGFLTTERAERAEA